MKIDYKLLRSRNYSLHNFEWSLREFLGDLNIGMYDFLIGPTKFKCTKKEIIEFVTSVVYGFRRLNITVIKNPNGTNTVLKGYKECIMLMMYVQNIIPREDEVFIDLKAIPGEDYSLLYLFRKFFKVNKTLVDAGDSYNKFSDRDDDIRFRELQYTGEILDNVVVETTRYSSLSPVTKKEIISLMLLLEKDRSNLEVLCNSARNADFLILVEALSDKCALDEILSLIKTFAKDYNMKLKDYCIKFKGDFLG